MKKKKSLDNPSSLFPRLQNSNFKPEKKEKKEKEKKKRKTNACLPNSSETDILVYIRKCFHCLTEQ